jgi:hypothetical protein
MSRVAKTAITIRHRGSSPKQSLQMARHNFLSGVRRGSMVNFRCSASASPRPPCPATCLLEADLVSATWYPSIVIPKRSNSGSRPIMSPGSQKKLTLAGADRPATKATIAGRSYAQPLARRRVRV